MGAALDPRLKLDILRSAYQKIDPRTSEEKVQVVRDNLILLYEEYQKSANPSKFSATLTPHELLTESPLEDDMDDEILKITSMMKMMNLQKVAQKLETLAHEDQ
ncbi:PREDICTED: uncharacterized protein LOC106301535 isoform X2 [Brassica oleracea var. oleracea]|uniref:uncharacterized protein LOC106301535 isoform X2 n=1 Tax=Brassica oleracea var. oleracea TaxID=109376 RepID=UPI0006A6AAFD|nr:PREDICTED: uncharacterized protein LOC106301535 isoform X2 [Brassica oleracea var. oleracea]